jgi:hypothetical protein
LGHPSVMLNDQSLQCQPGGLLCYTSVVITWAPTGSGTEFSVNCLIRPATAINLFTLRPRPRTLSRLVPRFPSR